MNIDWSKAPEWANAVVAARAGTLYFVEDFGIRSKRRAVSNSYDCSLAADMTIKNHSWKLIEERPNKQEAWDGVGLPPVGTVCEYQTWINREWKQTKILAHHLGFAVHSWSVYGDDMEVDAAPPQDFRSVRAPEQVAAENREKAIEEMIRTTSDGITCMDRYDAEQLYKAGYRKQ